MIVLKAENISKQYRLGQVGTGTFSHDLNRWWHKLRGKEDPYLKVGDANDRSKAGGSEYVWALKDINFEVEQGEVLGIIGRNGAGKSTLLKILSQVTSPTTGDIKVKGRIASLLEVGTGFHPELSGRENIFLNGAILGMTKVEIKSKLDEIVNFSGVAKYLDTPVKRYSSGMMVRLGFAVAAHLEPEILIVDEVLAVGDAEFQSQCMGKMKDVAEGGRTVLFVSHNMASIKALCKSAILLENGTSLFRDYTDKVVQQYLTLGDKVTENNIELSKNRIGTQQIQFADFFIENTRGTKIEKAMTGEDVVLVFVVKVNSKARNVNLGFSIHDSYGDSIAILYSSFQNIKFKDFPIGYHTIKVKIKSLPVSPGKVYIRGRIEENGIEADWYKDYLGKIEIEMGDFYNTGSIGVRDYNTKFLIKGEWEC